MQVWTKYWTKNDSLRNPRLCPVGVMIHSTATPGVMAADWYDRWNCSGIGKSVHFFVDNKEAWNYLPSNIRAAHAGQPANQMYISIEICEDKTHSPAYFAAAWENAVELTAMLVRQYGFSADDVISHKEGAERGIATNHIDPTHWWGKYARTMEDFRSDVRKKLEGKKMQDVSVRVGGTDITGVMINGVTYVPLRKLVDTIKDNLSVTWSQEDGAAVEL